MDPVALEEAILAARRAVEAAPASAQLYEELGALLTLEGSYVEAAQSLAAAISIDPSSPSALNNFGAVLRSIGKTEDAQRYFNRALDLAPSFHNALLNAMGYYMDRPQRYGEGIRRLYAAMAAGDRASQTHDMLGMLLARDGSTAQAMREFEHAVAIDAHNGDAWLHLAELQVGVGDLERAHTSLRHAARENPDRASIYRFMAATMPGSLTVEDRDTLDRLVARNDLDQRELLEAHYALGSIDENSGDFDGAFQHFSRANAILHANSSYDEETTLASFADIARAFDAQTMDKGPLGFHETDQPVFIFGMPRSGTTLVEQIVASHPLVFAGGELTLLDSFVEEQFAVPQQITAAVAIRYDEAVRRLAPQMAARVTDKMPTNFRYAGLIRMIFPYARMIHVRRDPLDTCWSCFSTRFSESAFDWTTDLGQLGRYYRGYARLMEHWRTVLPESSMLEVQYEELVGDFEAQARRIIAHCGLKWDDRCLRYYETERLVRTASASQVRRPPYSASIGRSRAYGEWLRPLADAIGIDF